VTLAIQIAIVVYVAVAGIAAWLLWNNAAAPDAVKNLGIGFASLLPLLVAILPYLNQEKLENRFSFVLLYDSLNKRAWEGNGWDPYTDSYREMLLNLSLSTKHTQFEDWGHFQDSGYDIIEKGIVQSLLSPGPVFWEGGPRTNWLEPEGFRLSHILSIDEVREIFRHNSLITTPGILYFEHWSLPPNSTLSAGPRRFSRTITITNPYGALSISIHAGGGGTKELWGIVEPNAKNRGGKIPRYVAVKYDVFLTFVPARFKNYETMVSYKRWYGIISDVLSEFDWKKVEEKIEKERTGEAISKTLKNQ
jgi:hypothetical protein